MPPHLSAGIRLGGPARPSACITHSVGAAEACHSGGGAYRRCRCCHCCLQILEMRRRAQGTCCVQGTKMCVCPSALHCQGACCVHGYKNVCASISLQCQGACCVHGFKNVRASISPALLFCFTKFRRKDALHVLLRPFTLILLRSLLQLHNRLFLVLHNCMRSYCKYLLTFPLRTKKRAQSAARALLAFQRCMSKKLRRVVKHPYSLQPSLRKKIMKAGMCPWAPPQCKHWRSKRSCHLQVTVTHPNLSTVTALKGAPCSEKGVFPLC